MNKKHFTAVAILFLSVFYESSFAQTKGKSLVIHSIAGFNAPQLGDLNTVLANEGLPQFKDLSFNSKTVGQRMAIIAAGPIANFLFAILLLWAMYLIGVPNIKPVIGQVTAESIAAKAGVPSNAQITAINGEPAEDWRAISLLLVEQVGSPAVDITVQQLEGSDQSYQLDLTDWAFDPDKQSVFGSLGLEPLRPEVLNEISQIQPGSAAETGGLQLGDKLVSVDGKAGGR